MVMKDSMNILHKMFQVTLYDSYFDIFAVYQQAKPTKIYLMNTAYFMLILI